MKIRCVLHGRVFVMVQRRMVLVIIFSYLFKLLLFCFAVAIFDIVHDMETIFLLPVMLTASGNLSEM